MKPRMRFARPLTPAPTAVTARDKVIEAIRAAKACPRHAPHTMSRTVLGGHWADACRACAGALIDALRALPADDRVALAEWLGVRARLRIDDASIGAFTAFLEVADDAKEGT